MNTAGTALVESTTLLLGWDLTSGTISVNLTNGYADLSSNAYMDSTGQRFHATEGETIYLYAEHNQSAGAGVNVAVLGYSTPDPDSGGFIQGSFSESYVGASQASGVNMGTKETDVSGRYLSVGKVTIAKTGYYSVRLKARGSAVRYYMVGASITPPVIDPVYAPTYIRDLSIDTLQIAGNAVTLADSSTTGAVASGGTTHDLETGLMPENSSFVWFINAIVNQVSGNPSTYDLVVKFYTKTTTGSYVLNSTHTIWIYAYGLDARIIKKSFPSSHNGDGYMKCEVRLQQHGSSNLVSSGSIEIAYVGAKK